MKIKNFLEASEYDKLSEEDKKKYQPVYIDPDYMIGFWGYELKRDSFGNFY